MSENVLNRRQVSQPSDRLSLNKHKQNKLLTTTKCLNTPPEETFPKDAMPDPPQISNNETKMINIDIHHPQGINATWVSSINTIQCKQVNSDARVQPKAPLPQK